MEGAIDDVPDRALCDLVRLGLLTIEVVDVAS